MTNMSMLNQAAVEALCSATYLENYLECLDSLPEELQRNISNIRELDAQYAELLREIEQHRGNLHQDVESNQRKRCMMLVQRALIKCQEVGDEKLQIVSQIIECVENRSRQLHQDLENLDPIGGKDPLIPEITYVSSSRQTKQYLHLQKQTQSTPQPSIQQKSQLTPQHEQGRQHQHHKQTSQQQHQQHQQQHEEQREANFLPVELKTGKRQRRQTKYHDVVKTEEKKTFHDVQEQPKKKKKKRRTKNKDKEGHRSPVDLPIDPDEPTYCVCDQVSYGEMIGCDNDLCEKEWFHFNCVNLNMKPKGKWYCPTCRGDTHGKIPRKDLK